MIKRKTINGKHVYTDGSNNYSGITSILGSVPKPWLDDWRRRTPNHLAINHRACRIGTIVHKYCEMRGILNRNQIDTSYIMYLKSWKAIMHAIEAFELFCMKHNPKFLHTELKLINSKLGYGCTVDAILSFDSRTFCLDYKTTTSINKDHEIQALMCTEAYKESTDSVSYDVTPAILHLSKTTGKFKFVEVEYNYYDEGCEIIRGYNNIDRGY